MQHVSYYVQSVPIPQTLSPQNSEQITRRQAYLLRNPKN
jgi:hypothetical protein